MNYRICVTEDDIKRGRRGSAHSCPIARAATRAILGREMGDDAMFTPDRVAVTGEIRVYRGRPGNNIDLEVCAMPQEAIEFVRAFDDHRPVEPIEFDAVSLVV